METMHAGQAPETKEAYRRLGMHSRLGKVRRLRKLIGDQEDAEVYSVKCFW